MGARLFRQDISSSVVGLFVNEVFDEHSKLRDELISWGMHCIFRKPPESLTARSWNNYLAIQEDRGK